MRLKITIQDNFYFLQDLVTKNFSRKKHFIREMENYIFFFPTKNVLGKFWEQKSLKGTPRAVAPPASGTDAALML